MVDAGADYELIDAGGAARLERFGERVVDRPAPTALGTRADPGRWPSADLRFDRATGWSGPRHEAGPWPVRLAGLTLELRTTEAGQVGLFPEHLSQLAWLRERLALTGPGSTVLHLFAYTGLATLALAEAGAAVTHVDASRPTVGWARHNADLAGLADRSIRWIVDDAQAFTEREGRRGRQFAGVVLDPPTYGHAPGAPAWRIETGLDRLLKACAAVIEPAGFVLLTAHTADLGPARLADRLATAFDRGSGTIERGRLTVGTVGGRELELGAFARSTGRAS